MKISKPTKRKIIIAVAIVVLIIIAVIVFLSVSSSKGTITTQYYNNQNQPKYQTLNGKTFSLQYDKRYAVGIPDSHNSDIEDYMLIADTIYDKRLAVSVAPLPTGRLTDDSAYNLRLVHPELYQPQTQQTPGGTATIFTKPDGSEETVFIQHPGIIIALAFTTTGATDKLTPEVNHLLGTFRWK